MARDIIDDFYPDENARGADEKLTVHDVLCDFKRAHEAKKKIMDAQKEDFEFALGKQWDDQDVEQLRKVGVRALTLNKIAPNLQLLRGMESQNRSDFRGYPEGDEDTIQSEIVTRLMKNAVKNSDLKFKVSDMFEAGNTCGEGWLEPWLQYPYKAKPDGTVDLTAQLRFKMNHYDQIFPDPCSREYDHSDARFITKFTSDLTPDELIELFPNQKKEIEDVEAGKIDIDAIDIGGSTDATGVSIQRKDYRADDNNTSPWIPRNGFDLIDYYYKRYVPKYYVADFKLNTVRLAKNKKEADRYVKQATLKDRNPKKPSAKLIERLQPEIWVAFVCGGMDDFLAHGPAWSFPRWESWPIFGYYAYKSSAPIEDDDRSLLIQGLTRRIKDNQREHNKRRTQELRHLNQSANSGWKGEENAFVNEDVWETYGSTPGAILKYKEGRPAPEKILPTPLSQGHAQMAEEHKQDMREALGIDAEALAIQSDQSSGRAIALRQKQGLVMVQGLFDNLSRTRYMVGKFILSVLPELFDVEKAMRVLGAAFLQKNFQSPVLDPMTQQPMIDPRTLQPAMQYDQNLAMQTINQVLSDAELGTFDVAVGDNISSETIRIANFTELQELAQAGYPIPPDVLVEESTLPDATKKRLMSAFAAQAAAGEAEGQQKPKPKGKGK